MSVLFVVPAKRHSSRCVDKNLRPLDGLPLFLWTVQAAREAKGPDDTVLVTTNAGPDGDEIARLAVHEGAAVVRRPAVLCRDPAQAPDVALHALARYEEQRGRLPDTMCMLLPTSPFRAARQIKEAVHLHGGSFPVVSVVDGAAFHHKLCIRRCERILAGPPLRDAELRTALWCLGDLTSPVALNGAIWIATPGHWRSHGHVSAIGALPYVMDEESGLDIDSELDFTVAEAILARRYRTVAA